MTNENVTEPDCLRLERDRALAAEREAVKALENLLDAIWEAEQVADSLRALGRSRERGEAEHRRPSRLGVLIASARAGARATARA